MELTWLFGHIMVEIDDFENFLQCFKELYTQDILGWVTWLKDCGHW